MYRRSLLTVGWMALTILAGRCLSAETIENERFGFKFDVPAGFTSVAVSPDSNILYRFLDREPSAEDPASVIQIVRLKGLINAKQRLTEADVPKPDQSGAVFSLSEPQSWQGWPLDVMDVKVATPNGTIMTLIIQFPLQGEGIQLTVGGPEERQLRKTLDVAVAGFVNTKPVYTGKPANSGTEGVADSTPAAPQPVEVPFPYKGLAIISVLVIILVAIVGKWIRSSRRKTNGSEE